MSMTRRDALKLGAMAAAATVIDPRGAEAQQPKRGGVFKVRHHLQPPHFDPHQTLAFSTMMPLSYCMSRLVKVKAGPSVTPGTQPLENDLAESWQRTNDTTFVFQLKKGVRWHNKPPVNGRELTSEDVRYTYDRFLNIKGNANRYLLESIDRIETPDKYTVRFVLKYPNAWFIDQLASTATWIVAKESIEKFGDMKKPEAVIGTGPWMMESYSPGQKLVYKRHPEYFVSGQPYADGVDVTIETDPATALANFIVPGGYDLGPEYGFIIRRIDLELAKQRVPGLQMRDFIVLFGGITQMKLDQDPFKDVRVRRALAIASSWRETLDTNAWSQGIGVPNTCIPAALKDWALQIDQLPAEGRRLYEHDTDAAKKLLADAGHPRGFKVPLEATPGYGPDFMDAVQVELKNYKKAGVEIDLKLKEYGAYISSTIFGKFEKMHFGLRGGQSDVESALRVFIPGEPLNAGGVNDGKLTEMIQVQRKTYDNAKRREVIADLQRYVSQQAYYLYGASVSSVGAWKPYVKNYSPNIGHDVGGRLMAAWLDR